MDDSAGDCLYYHQKKGLKTYFVVYDILPMLKPDWFPLSHSFTFKAWFEDIVVLADGLICISGSTARDIGNWLTLHPVKRTSPLQMGYFHLGADIEVSVPTSGMSKDDEALLVRLQKQTGVLMVGTIEPRKGYNQTLKAFEKLWMEGEEIPLVIVGRRGWKTENLVKHLRSHPDWGKHLFWLENASDEMLLRLYQTASVLLMSSEAEGFGLPLIEAARHRLPIIARDIPVFREIAGENAYYFRGTDGESLALTVKTWLRLYHENKHPRSETIRWLTWKESAQQLKQIIFESHWAASWDSKTGFRWHENISLSKMDFDKITK
jgi:glycosyltransferase involved in cell wall biosynthesis